MLLVVTLVVVARRWTAKYDMHKDRKELCLQSSVYPISCQTGFASGRWEAHACHIHNNVYMCMSLALLLNTQQ